MLRSSPQLQRKKRGFGGVGFIPRPHFVNTDEDTLSMTMKYDGEHFDVRKTPNNIVLAIAEKTSESIEYVNLKEKFTNLVTVKIK